MLYICLKSEFRVIISNYNESVGELDSPHSRAKAKADEERKIAIETALLEKVLKSRLATATEHFNLDAKKAFLYLQVSFPSFTNLERTSYFAHCFEEN